MPEILKPVMTDDTGKDLVDAIDDLSAVLETRKNTVPISKGGTGATTAEAARTNLGISDVNVNQIGITNPIPSSYNTYFEVLLSGTADNVSRSENSKKSPYLAFNPVTMDLYTNSVNDIRFGRYDGKAGYYEGGTFKAFKDPTGTASAGDVLSGKTFANADSDTLVTGTMDNYSGANRRTITPTGGQGSIQMSLPPGYHDSVIVDKQTVWNNGYDEGYADAESITWTEDLTMESTSNLSSSNQTFITKVGVRDVERYKLKSRSRTVHCSSAVSYWDKNGAQISSIDPVVVDSIYYIPTNAYYMKIEMTLNPESAGSMNLFRDVYELKKHAKLLR